jgi:hypothetical protein
MSDMAESTVRAHQGFFPLVVGHDVRVDNGGGAVFIAKRDLAISRGGGQWLVAGRDQTIEQGGGALLLSRRARVTQGLVGVLVAGRVSLDGGARALVHVSLPVAAAAVAGLAIGLVLGRLRA